ncbi:MULTISPECIES: DUF397 domain-containing protein [Streptomyces]|jgi:hypothetical protein|uniref:DUF397 domain-containing protein n=2 Tax=Streptomyces TaxID=1883 RepID=A0A1G7FCS5_9ACTN|nr:DUF397 domain-containing protein [Streptomyces jietaisiensis]SDE73729.1 protein of unknown function [Streptomyces jietaisiensis]
MTEWQKSSFSGGGDGDDCVELGHSGTGMLLREGDEPGLILAVSPASLAQLIRHLRSEPYDRGHQTRGQPSQPCR